MDNLFYFTICGLLYDGTGVLLLGYAFFGQSKKMIRQESGTYLNFNPYILKEKIYTKFDGMAGSLLLFLGFFFQILGQFYTEYESVVMYLYILLFIGLLEYFFVVRKKRVEEWFDELKELS